MDQRRQIVTVLVATTLFMAWMTISPLLFPKVQFPGQKPRVGAGVPPAAPEAGVPDPVAPEGGAPENGADQPEVVANNPDAPPAQPADGQPPAAAVNPADAPPVKPEPKVELRTFEHHDDIVIGDVDDGGATSGFLLKAQLSTRGGAVNWVRLTDRERDNPYIYLGRDKKNITPDDMLKVIGNSTQRNVGGETVPRSFEITVPALDKVLGQQEQSLASVDWEIVERTNDSVTFRYPSPAGDLAITKKYSIAKVDPATRDADPAGYLLKLDIKIQNLSAANVTTEYSLTGPVGLPLEDPANSRLYREVKVGTLPNPRNPNRVTALNLLASKLVSQVDEAAQPKGDPVPDWREPVQYAGVDCQFFAALVVPRRNQLEDRNGDGKPDPEFAVVRPQLLLKTKDPNQSDLTIILDSTPITIPSQQEVTHSVDVFLGPKRPELLQPLKADRIMQLGQFLFGEWSWVAAVSKLMLSTLNVFHSYIGLPYAACIILLTVIVRGMMLPISRKQVAEAEKMRVLAPELKKIQDQYKDKPEEFTRAYRDFQKKHNYHPMAGCLPSLLQLPIFIGLYNSLSHAVDLRLASFLWIENLAGPDALFQLGFTIPWLNWTEFNLLPFLTVGLMLLQQKMFTPPPTSEEQAMQMRMMNFMMLFIGFAFYRVPAGLCLYFIASSLWGVAERTLLAKKPVIVLPMDGDGGGGGGGGTLGKPVYPVGGNGKKPEDAKPKAPSWLQRMLEAADNAKHSTEGQSAPRKFSKGKGNKGR